MRIPLSSPAVNLAGKPSKVGGTVARAFGWTVLGIGLLVACVFATLFGLVFSGAAAALVGVPIAVVATLFAVLLLRGGRSLKQSGADAETATRLQAVFALATHKGGTLTSTDVALALQMPGPDADALLVNLAKKDPDVVSVDVDDEGQLLFHFPGALPVGQVRWPERWPERWPQEPQPKVRVNAPPQAPRVVDVELEEMEQAVRAARPAR
jgi:hypothetical protein